MSLFAVYFIDIERQNSVYSQCMFNSLTVLAPAKINLGLKVYRPDTNGVNTSVSHCLNKSVNRTDGYHNIESVFATIPLFDEITVSVVSGDSAGTCGCSVECVSDSGIDLCLDPVNNTFYNTYKAFCVLTGVKENVHVRVNKRIPAGGGLGGGSSDASSFLKSIDTIFSTHLTREDFLGISAQVGSDVFFFTEALLEQGLLVNGSCEEGSDTQGSFVKRFHKLEDYAGVFKCFCAFVEGRGEIVRPFEGKEILEAMLSSSGDWGLQENLEGLLGSSKILLVLPGVSVSTKTAYGLVDKAKDLSILHNGAKLEDCWKTVLSELKSVCLGDSEDQKKLNWKHVNEFCVNDFTAPITAEYPVIGDALEALKASGADFADMSGSGATLYGIFCNETKRVQAASGLLSKFNTVLL